MSETLQVILALWIGLSLAVGTFASLSLDDRATRPVSSGARVAAAVLAALVWPAVAPWYLARGLQDLYRLFYPKKVSLPKAQVIR